MTNQRPVASLLRQLREDRGASLRSTATDLGVAPSHLSRIERGEKRASQDVVRRAANYYGVDPQELTPDVLPEDVLQILRDHPAVIEELRLRYAT
jgi:transcriptional regulator with XRE-family HTH domain